MILYKYQWNLHTLADPNGGEVMSLLIRYFDIYVQVHKMCQTGVGQQIAGIQQTMYAVINSDKHPSPYI